MISLNPANLIRHLNIAEGVLGRFLSFASFELPRFIGSSTMERLAFLKDNLWLIPFALFLLIVGITQPVAMVALWFFRSHAQSDWKAVKHLTLYTVLLLYASFLFTPREPDSHTYYVTFPVAMIYSLYCWSRLLRKRRWQIFVKVFVVSGIIFHTGLALHNRPRVSLYVDRNIPQSAINAKSYHILGERRAEGRY